MFMASRMALARQRIAAAAGGIQFINFATAIDVADSTTTVVNKPVNTADGDLMIAVGSSRNISAQTWTVPAGWNEVRDQNGPPNLLVAWKIAASEGANWTFTLSNSAEKACAVITYRGAAYDTVGASVVTSSGTGDIAASQITSAGGVLLAAYAKNATSSTFSTPTGMSVLTGDINNAASDASLNVFSQIVSAGATGTRTSTPSANATNGGILIGIKAA